jgi:hypothetical protein
MGEGKRMAAVPGRRRGSEGDTHFREKDRARELTTVPTQRVAIFKMSVSNSGH